LNSGPMGGPESRLSDEERKEVLYGDPSLASIARRILEGKSKKILVLTGAGISVSAGIPDFRNPKSGIYSKETMQKYNVPSPAAVFDANYLMVDPRPLFSISKDLFYPVYKGTTKPTPTHYFIKLLHDKGILLRNYTQNIDMLELKAGIPKESVVEAHGTYSSAYCVKCRKTVDDMKTWWETIANEEIPLCNCGGVQRPNVVFFGESLPSRFWEKKSEDLNSCDLLIVIGTSLVVFPFAGLVNEVGTKTPRLLINRDSVGAFRRVTGEESPPAYGIFRDVVCLGDSDDGVKKLAALLGWTDELNKHINSN